MMAAVALTAVLAAGCSSEQSSLSLAVTVSPNPVTGTDGGGGRLWDFKVSITNTSSVGVRLENFHARISRTDTGYERPLVLEESAVIEDLGTVGRYIRPGGTLSYSASRESEGYFTRGRELRIYHCLGDDGVYYSGEVAIELQ